MFPYPLTLASESIHLFTLRYLFNFYLISIWFKRTLTRINNHIDDVNIDIIKLLSPTTAACDEICELNIDTVLIIIQTHSQLIKESANKIHKNSLQGYNMHEFRLDLLAIIGRDLSGCSRPLCRGGLSKI